MAQEMVHGVVHRQGRVLRPGEPVHIAQDLRRRITQVKVQLAPTAQFTAEEQEPPPGEKLGVVLDERLMPRVRQRGQPLVQRRPEVLDRVLECLPEGA